MRTLTTCLFLEIFLFCSVCCAKASTSFTVRTYSKDISGVTLQTGQGAIRIDVCSDRIFHVIASPGSDIPTQKIATVIHSWKPVHFSVTGDAMHVQIETTHVRVEVDRSNGAIGFFTAQGSPILQEASAKGRKFTPEIIQGIRTWQVEQSFVSPPDEALYGLGQHQEGWFNLREIPFRLQQANTNISIPFLLSTKGYGILWNNASVTDYDPADRRISINPVTGEGTFSISQPGDYGFLLASDETEQLRLKVDGKSVIDLHSMWMPDTAGGHMEMSRIGEHNVMALGGKKGVSLYLREPSNLTTFRSTAGDAADYYFIYGPSLNKVIAEYRLATGEAPLFPKWAYGFWQCRERYSSQQQILDTVEEFRRRNIPVDVFVQDWMYWGKYGWNAMRFDETNYPHPTAMMKSLHQENVHLVISVWPKFGVQTRVYQQMKAQHLLIPGETPTHEKWMDAFNPKAQKLFWADIDQGLFKKGIDGWWLDASEPEFHPLQGKPTYLGLGDFVQNAYPLYETSAVYNGQRATTENKRVVILTRSSFLGQQRNAAASWSGDITGNWETLRRQIPAGLNFSMSGIPYWTTDIGGFFRPSNQYTSEAYHELLIRWFEYGTFCPIFRIHGYQTETEMWKFGPQVEQILRSYDNLRYRLMPYIYSTAWGITSQGATMMRALPLDYPKDPKVIDIGNEFLFGPSLLISPVTKPKATKRTVYLPAGTAWFDFWTGQRNEGGQTIQADAPIDKMPIFAKAGSILAMGPMITSSADRLGPIDLRIYPGQDGEFQLYEDSGDSYRYEKGEYSTISMHWDDKVHTLSIDAKKGRFPGMLKKRTFRVFWVRDGYGTGIKSDPTPDYIVQYTGKSMRIYEPSKLFTLQDGDRS